MDDIERLEKQVEELEKVVSGLKKSTIKVETNSSKLQRLKNEIIRETFPQYILDKMDNVKYGDLKKNLGIISNDLFFLQTKYKHESYSKMPTIIFERPESEERLEAYLGIYKRAAEFMAKEYEKADFDKGD